ncbi:MAG: hypothetical protein OXH15_13895 [Gammaproteobacteria bacterium]|nr:hypothetical protein [Gammaproteobacteria bacterium]
MSLETDDLKCVADIVHGYMEVMNKRIAKLEHALLEKGKRIAQLEAATSEPLLPHGGLQEAVRRSLDPTLTGGLLASASYANVAAAARESSKGVVARAALAYYASKGTKGAS